MNFFLSDIEQLVRTHPHSPGKLKSDGSMVTDLDLALSDLIAEISQKNYPNYIFYSEENYSTWGIPLLAVDPLDGTREYLANRPEWAISVAQIENENFEGEGWIYNPITKELFDSPHFEPFLFKEVYSGEVSRSEWESGFFLDKQSKKFRTSPMGSIAYKLGRLSRNKIDFVVSLRAKNVWDIAAGTILAAQSGYQFYSEGKKVTKVQKKYSEPLIWCREEIFLDLNELFS